MVRRVVTTLMVLGATVTAGLPTAWASAGAPVLGARGAFQAGKGFGSAEPRIVYLGGDPTGYVSKITWRHWGEATAVGFGQGWCPGRSVAAGHYCLAALHVWALGRCHRRPE